MRFYQQPGHDQSNDDAQNIGQPIEQAGCPADWNLQQFIDDSIARNDQQTSPHALAAWNTTQWQQQSERKISNQMNQFVGDAQPLNGRRNRDVSQRKEGDPDRS